MACETILERIPHRPPFLFVDELVAETETTITTRWTPPADADFFRGHYPENPILPGVLMLEMLFQSAAIWFAGRALADDESLAGTVPVLTRIAGGRFKRQVRPGEPLTAELELTEALGPARFMKARLKNEAGKLVVSCDFAVAAAPAEGSPR
ncbi:MAG: beta-hydroxyacyl-ACP dehydratase [Planctomycetota bacterium]|nr:beta-hydroxyacyl-ACP dehydratase [Planctomycetota bacterium]